MTTSKPTPGALTVAALVVALLLALHARADVTLAAVVSRGMVLQQDTNVAIWGWATPGERVEVKSTFAVGKFNARADQSGAWRVFVRTPLAEEVVGPQSIVVTGRNRVQVDDILIGEVWVCSGQSNMEMFVGAAPGVLGGVDRWEEELKDADYPEIRLFDVPNRAAATPQADCKGAAWSRCTPERVAKFSATAFFFGRELHRQLHVPIGLITADWGGTPIQAWTSLEGLKHQPGFEAWTPKLELARDHPEQFEQESRASEDAWRKTLDAADPGTAGGWSSMDVDESAWKDVSVPGAWERELGEFDGIMWLRKAFDVAPADAGKACVLDLGPIDDHDETWLNGVKAGEHFEPGSHATPRSYAVAPGVLRAGRNVVVVRVLDTGGAGGISGGAPGVQVRVIDGGTLRLEGAWKAKVGAALADLPPRPDELLPRASSPSMLFNGMIAPIAGYGAKGFAWYQGESDRREAFRYRTMFWSMIEDWRRVWERGAMPFCFVQIAPYRYAGDRGETAELREAQASALRLPATGMAVTMDIGDPRDIHPRNKQEVGRRLALVALNVAYARSAESSGPVYRSMKVEGRAVRLSFDHAKGLAPAGAPLTCFAIAGEDRVFVPAQAVIDGDTVVVSSDRVAAPAAVRMAWGDADEPNLKNGAGLPAPPFRTDDWPGVTGP